MSSRVLTLFVILGLLVSAGVVTYAVFFLPTALVEEVEELRGMDRPAPLIDLSPAPAEAPGAGAGLGEPTRTAASDPDDPRGQASGHRQPRTLTVRVVDDAGSPVGGIPVLWSWFGEEQVFRPLEPALAKAVSEPADGIARFAELPSPPVVPAPREGCLAANIVAPDWRWQVVAIEPWPLAPVELRLPPIGAVEVLAPELPPGAAVCDLGILPEAGADPMLRYRSIVRLPLADGRAFFPAVALGERLEAELRVEGTEGSFTVRGDGPTAPGQLVTLRAEGAAPVLLSGRLLDPAGTPVALGRVHWRVSCGDALRGDLLQTDEAGGFRLALPSDLPEQGAVLLCLQLEPSAKDASGGAGGPPADLEASIELPAALLPGEHRLGDLVLAPPPMLAAGLVTTAGGDPVADAEVYGEALVDKRGEKEFWWRSFPALPVTAVKTGGDGRFEIRGRIEGSHLGRFRLQVRREGFRPPAPVEIALGAEDLRIVLEVGAALAVRFAVPDGLAMPAGELSLVLAPSAGGEELRCAPAPAPGEEFVWSDLAAGRYRLEVRHACAVEPLATLEGIELAAGQVLRDARLQPFELGEHLGVARLRVFAPDGTLWSTMLNLEWLEPGGGRNGRARPRTPVSDFLLPYHLARPCDLLVGAEGRSVEILPSFSSDQEVVLGETIEVVVRPREGAGHPSTRRSLLLQVERLQLASSSRVSVARARVSGTLARDGEFRVAFPGPGRYRWRWLEQEEVEAGDSITRPLKDAPSGEWHIDESSRGAVLEIDAPAAAGDGS